MAIIALLILAKELHFIIISLMVYSQYLMDSPLIHVLWAAAAGGITLFLPGAAVLAWIPQPGLDFPQKAGRALGLSMALTCLFGLVTFLTGLRFSTAGMILLYLGFILLGVVGWRRKRPGVRPSRLDLFGFGLIFLVAAVILAWRFYQARDLVLPAWVDSVQHVLIVQAIIARGGVPASLVPFVPVPFYYHFGFHVLAAGFAFWSQLPADQAVLIMGQILMAAMSLAVYRLTVALWKDSCPEGSRLRGIAAAVLVAFVSQMPGYYLTWGRYTLLTGLTLGALAIAEVVESTTIPFAEQEHQPAVVNRPVFKVSTILIVALMVSGVLLSHYLVALVLALFLIFLVIRFLWNDLRDHCISFTRWIPLVGGVTLGTLLALPWLLWVISFSFRSFHIDPLLPSQPDLQNYASYLWSLAGPLQNHVLILLAILGMVLALLKPAIRVFAVWSLVLALLCLPIGVQLGPMRPDIVVMMIFLPVVVLAGHLLISTGSAAARFGRRSWLAIFVPAVCLILFSMWGMYQTGNIINPVTVFVNRSDRQALDWIDHDIPADARFYINTTPWQGPTYRGVDGGWWILSLTGRQMLLPPVMYTWGEPAYVKQINTWAAQASKITTCSPDFWQVVRQSGADYIYIHSGVGALQPQGLQDCSGIEQIYSVDGVDIYQITNSESYSTIPRN